MAIIMTGLPGNYTANNRILLHSRGHPRYSNRTAVLKHKLLAICCVSNEATGMYCMYTVLIGDPHVVSGMYMNTETSAFYSIE